MSVIVEPVAEELDAATPSSTPITIAPEDAALADALAFVVELALECVASAVVVASAARTFTADEGAVLPDDEAAPGSLESVEGVAGSVIEGS